MIFPSICTPSKTLLVTVLFCPLCLCFQLDALATEDTQERDICSRDGVVDTDWLDRTQAFFSENACESAIWFDRFFGGELDTEEGVGSFLRLSEGIKWTEGGQIDNLLRLNARVRLPRISKRFQLFISGQNDDDLDDSLSSDSNLVTGTSRENQEEYALGFRWDPVVTQQSSFQLSTGLRLRRGLPLVRARYRYHLPITTSSLARFTETLFWQGGEGFGTRTRVELEHVFGVDSLIRWRGVATYSEESEGIDWQAGMSFFHHFSRHEAIEAGFSIDGFTDPEAEIEGTRIFTRYRRNIYRPWLFIEIEPEVSWPLNRDTGSHESAVFGIIGRVEIQFGRRL